MLMHVFYIYVFFMFETSLCLYPHILYILPRIGDKVIDPIFGCSWVRLVVGVCSFELFEFVFILMAMTHRMVVT